MLKRRSDDSKMQIILDVILTELCLVSDMLQKSFKKPSALTYGIIFKHVIPIFTLLL